MTTARPDQSSDRTSTFRTSLAGYRRKRDFSRSPEPRGSHSRTPVRTRLFCVQKHLASHLHYDFRLEHHGVLLSWANPKGPSLNPAIKRLAVQVEDHPLEYGGFEGVIPEGYGAGIVMLWDRGSWLPLSKDLDRALAKGHLQLVLAGTKLRGAWNLVRLPKPGGKTWLLIKQQDQWASAKDVTVQAPLSVAGSGQDNFEHILARERTEPWLTHAPVGSGETGALFQRIIARARALRKTVKPRARDSLTSVVAATQMS